MRGRRVGPGSMLADVADLDELNEGRRREGLFFGLTNFGEKVGAGMALLLAGVLLDVFVRLTPSASQTEEATLRIGLLYGIGPALLLAAAAVAIAGYDLNKAAVGAIQRALEGRAEVTTIAARVDASRRRLTAQLELLARQMTMAEVCS